MSTPVRMTVIVVNYNGGEFVLECLDSLEAQHAPGLSWEVVLVDNASTDGSLERIESLYPEIRIIKSATNLGFGGGVNLAVQQTSSELIVLINNDAVADTGYLKALDDAFRAGDDQLAAVTARILLAGRFTPASADDASAYVSPTGERWRRIRAGETGVFLVNSTGNQVSRTGNGRDRSWLEPAVDDDQIASVFGLCGGGAAIRRDLFETLGPFDARLFMYYEDTDLSWKFRRAGYRISYAPAARLQHRHAASSGTRSHFFISHNVRNRILVSARNAPRQVARAALVRTLGSLAKSSLRSIGFTRSGIRDAWVQTGGTISGLTQALWYLPSYRKSGRELDKSSVLSRDFLWDWAVDD